MAHPVLAQVVYPSENYDITRLSIVDAFSPADLPAGTSILNSWPVDEGGTGSAMCYELSNNTAIIAGNGSGSLVMNANSSYAFSYLGAIKAIEGLELLDTSGVTDFTDMFSNCGALEVLDLSTFDTGTATNMTNLFSNCSALKTIVFGHNWSTENVTSMAGMFANCSGLNALDLSRFDTSSIAASGAMMRFAAGCSSLSEITLGKKFPHNASVLPKAGNSRSLFYVAPGVATVVYNANDDAKSYGWAADNRAVTFEESQYLISYGTLSNIAEAIRSKTGSTDSLTPSQMVAAILGIGAS